MVYHWLVRCGVKIRRSTQFALNTVKYDALLLAREWRDVFRQLFPSTTTQKKTVGNTSKSKNTGQVPFMITADMQTCLLELGYSKADISAMTPAQAQQIINEGRLVKTPNVKTVDGNKSYVSQSQSILLDAQEQSPEDTMRTELAIITSALGAMERHSSTSATKPLMLVSKQQASISKSLPPAHNPLPHSSHSPVTLLNSKTSEAKQNDVTKTKTAVLTNAQASE